MVDTKKEPANAKERKEASFLAARGEWNERYGSYHTLANNWRLLALIEAVALVVSIGGLVYVSSQSHIQPYVVEVDKLHATLPIGPADQASKVDQRIIRAALASWIEAIRSVTPDAAAQTKAVQRAYGFIMPSSAAFGITNEYMRANDPFKRAETGTVTAAVESILPLGGNAWRVEWVETERTRDGRVVGATNYQANLTTAIEPPKDEQTLFTNPLGIYITNLSWSERL